jgi:ParB/RepB/Spo0J family partition protein
MARRTGVAEAARARLQVSSEAAAVEVEESQEPVEARAQAAYAEVPATAVAPNRRNVRQDLGDLGDLSASIAEVGVLQPLVVRPVTDAEAPEYPAGTRYVVVMGHRRLAASLAAGRAKVPVLVRSDAVAAPERERQAMLIENLLRQDLSPVEEARAFQQVLDEGSSQHQLARQIGVSQAHISRRLGLLRLDEALLELVAAGRLGVDLAVTTLGGLPAELQQQLAAELVDLDGKAGELIPASQVRSATDRLLREAEAEARTVAQRQVIADRGGRAAEQGELDDDGWRRRLHTEEAIAEAAAAGDLLGVPSKWNDEPTYFTAAELPPAEREPRADPEAAARREWTARRKAVAAWVAGRVDQVPRKTELAEVLARHIVDSMHHDVGTQVHGWLQESSHYVPGQEYHAWQAGLAELPSRDLLRVAWLATVAADLYGSRWASDSDRAARTQARVGEVQQ